MYNKLFYIIHMGISGTKSNKEQKKDNNNIQTFQNKSSSGDIHNKQNENEKMVKTQ